MERLTYRMSDGTVNWHGCITQAEMANRLAAYEAVENNGGWISVKDRLPNDGMQVLFMDSMNDVMQVGAYDCPHWYTNDGLKVDASHWKPLPEPPKEAANEKRE